MGLSVEDIIGGGSGDRVKGIVGTLEGVLVTRFLSAVEARYFTSDVGAIAVKR